MKPAWEWDEAELLSLIQNQVQESLTLDYKASPALDKTDGKKNEVSKDVSAFANSAGGTIVYGITETGQLPTGLDTGFDPNDISREWLEQVINSRVQPRIDGVRIKAITLATTHPGRVAYVVSIPQSMRAPHQAADKRYYRRYNFQSVAMEDFEIKDIGRRANQPVLMLDVQETSFSYISSDRYVDMRMIFKITNGSTATANFAVITMGVVQPNSAPSPNADNWSLTDASDEYCTIFRLVLASGSHRGWSPITPGFTLMTPDFPIRTPVYPGSSPRRIIVGMVRVDHDGGASVYHIEYYSEWPKGSRLRLTPGTADPSEYLRLGRELNPIFLLSSS